MCTVPGMQPTVGDEHGDVGPDGDRTLISQFIRIDMIGAAGGVAFVTIVNGVAVRERGVWVVVPFLLALIAALAVARRLVHTALGPALALVMVGNWIVAVAVSVLFPFLWPVMILAVLLPLVLATPYLAPGTLGVAIAGSAVVGAVVAGIGLLLDDEGVIEDIDDTAELVLVIGALAALIVPIALVIRQNNALQRTALERARALNVELSRSARELLASRRRVVEAADTERSRIERNLHDGAQQRLLALGMRLRLLESRTADSPDVHESVAGLSSEVDATVEELRELAHGIYPPLLETSGLAEALTAAARRAPGDVQADIADVGRHGRGVESALYFTALEALSNAAKYAPGVPVRLRLERADGAIRLEVGDDGPGFDTDDAVPSLGLLSMTDRVAAIGGELAIDSRTGAGTTVVAVLPT